MKKMYKFAIVEDSVVELEMLKQSISQYGQEKGLRFIVDEYRDIENFLSAYKTDYDLLFLDIELPGKNGMDGARLIREVDTEVIIIFVTNVAGFAVQGYEVNATDYILKPVEYCSFSAKLTRALEGLSKKEGKTIIVSGKENVYRFKDDEIVYVEVMGHTLIFHMTDGRIVEVTGSLNRIEEELKDYGFIRCKSCFLVNMKYISLVSKRKVKMISGEELEITRERKKGFMTAFLHHCATQE